MDKSRDKARDMTRKNSAAAADDELVLKLQFINFSLTF